MPINNYLKNICTTIQQIMNDSHIWGLRFGVSNRNKSLGFYFICRSNNDNNRSVFKIYVFNQDHKIVNNYLFTEEDACCVDEYIKTFPYRLTYHNKNLANQMLGHVNYYYKSDSDVYKAIDDNKQKISEHCLVDTYYKDAKLANVEKGCINGHIFYGTLEWII